MPVYELHRCVQAAHVLICALIEDRSAGQCKARATCAPRLRLFPNLCRVISVSPPWQWHAEAHAIQVHFVRTAAQQQLPLLSTGVCILAGHASLHTSSLLPISDINHTLFCSTVRVPAV